MIQPASQVESKLMQLNPCMRIPTPPTRRPTPEIIYSFVGSDNETALESGVNCMARSVGFALVNSVELREYNAKS